MGRWERGRPNTLAQQRLQQMRMGHENVLLRKKTQRIASTRFLRLWWPTLRVALRIGIHRPQEWGLHGEKSSLSTRDPPHSHADAVARWKPRPMGGRSRWCLCLHKSLLTKLAIACAREGGDALSDADATGRALPKLKSSFCLKELADVPRLEDSVPEVVRP